MAPSLDPAKLAVFLEELTERIGYFTVGFAKINDADEDAVLAGSGTLVSIGESKFILTADHVLQHLPDNGPVGLLLENRSPPQVQRVEIQMDMVDKITVARGASKSEGPDLGIMLLHGPIIGTIAAKKSFYDLTRRRDLILKNRRNWTRILGPFGGGQ